VCLPPSGSDSLVLCHIHRHLRSILRQNGDAFAPITGTPLAHKEITLTLAALTCLTAKENQDTAKARRSA